ncbi:MAG: 4Fe-4S binding protein [Methanosarcinaceae archaeon]|nr:4Fe-4S binding protein [Methanosarcinaceae archaeon]
MIINQDCVGCAQCVAFCEQDAIKVKGRAYIMEACIDCGFCAAYCPMKAIEVPV